ncbi:putative F-box domain-containing protein [Helianthus anomalus]
MAELALDVVEDILVRLDVEDLIRCKSVCKSWYSFISCSRFVKAHLNHAYNNDPELGGHRRIALSSILSIDNNCVLNGTHIVGSCNGLVCVSPLDFELLVTNSLTREEKKLPTPPFRPNLGKFALMREIVCWGFGYDFSTDDYKVIAGFRETPSRKLTVFYALTLKSNLWKVIGEVKYRCIDGFNGVLCGGALHWFMSDKYKRVIISLDLSTQEFKEIPQPADEEYVNDVVNDVDDIECFLGVIEEYLCIYWDRSPLSSKTWVMKNNTWELYNNDHCETKYDVSHSLLVLPKRNSSNAYALGDGKCVPSAGPYVRASIFVKSLVSPHPHSKNYEGQKRNMNKVRSKCLFFRYMRVYMLVVPACMFILNSPNLCLYIHSMHRGGKVMQVL